MKETGGGGSFLKKSNSAFCLRPLLLLLAHGNRPHFFKSDLRFFSYNFARSKSKIISRGKALK
jgi:hypothetical protein